MSKIMYQYPQSLTKKQIYDLTEAPEGLKFSDHVGSVISVEAMIIREAVNSDGVIQHITSIQEEGGIVYATNSETVANHLLNAIAIGDIKTLEIVSGTTKNNRTYIDIIIRDFVED